MSRPLQTVGPASRHNPLPLHARGLGHYCQAISRRRIPSWSDSRFASAQPSQGGHFDAEAAEYGVGGPPAHAPMRPGHVIAIGQPLLPVAPLIGAGVKQ